MIKASVLGVLAASSVLLAFPAAAQGRASAQASAATRAPTLAERQAAWNANKAEYRRRLAADGQRSADRWLDRQALAMRGNGADAAKAPGTTGAPAPSRAGTRGKKECKKVRWVNRATPGFGGGPMTMSRVAVCAD